MQEDQIYLNNNYLQQWINDSCKVRDIYSLEHWVSAPLLSVCPHYCVLFSQSMSRPGSHMAVRSWSFGVESQYLELEASGGNFISSPMVQKSISTQGIPQYFDIYANSADICPIWARRFHIAGFKNVLIFSHSEEGIGSGLFTATGIYNINPQAKQKVTDLVQMIMPRLCTALRTLTLATAAWTVDASASLNFPKLTPVEEAVVSLLLEGKSNKEIAKALHKSDQTVKRQLSDLMRKFEVRNRTELVSIYRSRQSNQ